MQKYNIMDLEIEKKISEYKTHIIDYATLKSILVNLNYLNINDKIDNLKQKGIIKSIKKGLYVHTSVVNKNIISKELISNRLLEGPSYVSLDYALYFYGLIPEAVHTITAVTTKRSKKFDTEFGIFSYQQIKKELFAIGIKIENLKNGNFMIAGKEKAICDKIYFTKDIKIVSKQAMVDFLENDLRIDLDELTDFNTEIISKYYKVSRSKKIQILLKIIKEL